MLAMADATGAELIPGLVDILETEAPGVSIQVLPLTTRDPRPMLDDESADLAVGYFPAVLADLTARAPGRQGGRVRAPAPVRRQIRVRDAPRPPAGQRPVDTQPLLRRAPPAGEFFRAPVRLCRRSAGLAGRERRVVLTVNQFFTAGQVVAQSNLLTVLPRHFVSIAGSADDLVQRELPFDVPAVQVASLWHSRVEHSGAHQWLRQAIARSAQKAFEQAPTA